MCKKFRSHMLKISFRWAGKTSYALLILFMIYILFYRAFNVWKLLSYHTGCNGFFFLNVIHHDAPVIGLELLLVYLAFYHGYIRSTKYCAISLKALIVIILILYSLDALLLVTIYERLNFGDIIKYGSEFSSGLTLLAQIAPDFSNIIPKQVVAFIICCLFLSYFFFFVMFKFSDGFSKWHQKSVLSCGIFLFLLGFIPTDHSYMHGWVYQNLFAYNLPKGVDKPYSDNFIKQLAKRRNDKIIESEGLGKHPNIILLIVESLSSSHSKFFSGINDYTPCLDRIAKDNISLTNFFANSFSTEQGLIALLLGEVPFPGSNHADHTPFGDFYLQSSLPSLLKTHDYETHFITTGDLSFLNKNTWLRHIGFDVVQGHETPSFEGWPRYAFNAAPDEALYKYAMQEIRKLDKKNEHYFITLETVSSHMPYQDPNKVSNTEEGIFKYVDCQIGDFYQNLKESGFFQKGMLIITSDHRVMAPLTEKEKEVFGLSAFTRIPLIAVWGDKKSKIESCFQQTDLISSIEWIMTLKYKTDPWHGIFFQDTPRPPFSIFHHMANNRDLIYVRCGSGEGIVKLDGDITKLVKGEINTENLESVLDKINSDRVFRCEKNSRP